MKRGILQRDPAVTDPEENTEFCFLRQSPGRGGVLPEKLGGGVRPAS